MRHRRAHPSGFIVSFVVSLALVLLFDFGVCLGQEERSADLILTNGVVYVEPRAAAQSTPGKSKIIAKNLIKNPTVEAIAFRSGDVVRLGDNATVMAQKGPGTKVIDLKGKAVLPAFHDGYIKLFAGGLRLTEEVATSREVTLRQALLKAQEVLISAGFVSLSGPITEEEIKAIKALALEGNLTLRMELWGDLNRPDEFIELREEHKKLLPRERIRFGGVQAELDGELINRTAALLEPYADAAEVEGVVRYTQDTLNEKVLAANRKGLSVILKASGDRAVNMAITAFGNSRKLLFNDRLRNRIIGADLVQEGVRARFSELGITVVAEPDILVPDPGQERVEFVGLRLGPKRKALAYPWNTIKSTGGHLVFGSTWPERELAPFKSISAALLRPGLENTKERLKIEDSIDAYTYSPAHATREEHVKGGLAEGKFGDAIVVSSDPYKTPPKKIKDIKVLMTISGGRIVFEAERN
jgi:predicted amidohydrolase YtcJ